MSLSLILNSNNVVNNGANSLYSYNFIGGGLNIPENSMMCISNVTIPYSWFNVNANLYNNASFQYTFPTLGGQLLYNIQLPNGFYNVTDINSYIQSIMIQRGQYLVNSVGQYVYYITIQYDINYYAVQLITYAVPNNLPVGYTNPGNMSFPVTSATPQLIISDTNNFGELIGFKTGEYPAVPQNTNVSCTSNTVPDGSPVNALIMRCNLVDNNVVMPSDVIDSIPINAAFGSNITYQPPFPKWVKMKPGRYSNMNIQLVDQNLNPIVENDSNILITLLFQIGAPAQRLSEKH